MQNISCEMLGWMKHKLESRLPGLSTETALKSFNPLFYVQFGEKLLQPGIIVFSLHPALLIYPHTH